MYLKRLELKGFKSFPTKTDIIFKEGVTAIVGPNGSGKSNISDSVRWVLGEQSIKSLRGDKLEDVIFAGTDTKKPMNYCEVALTIDNSDNKLDLDFSEITIKRRAYRNGESEFFLNNKSCRLKDIKEILLDTGIGKDGYSIIEQGKVDEILSNNPLNRRKVFDEACGISKFRYKKQEAERNLKNTKENLERIHDIYVEIENQLKPLYTQQEKAKKYIQVSEQLKKLEVNSYIKEIESLEIEFEEVNKHSELLESQSKEIQNQKELIENSSKETSLEIDNIDESINKSQDYINTIKSVISQKEAQVNLINEKIRNLSSDIERKYKELSDIKEKLGNDKILLEELELKRKNTDESINILEKNIEEIEIKNSDKKTKIESLNDEIENLKDGIINLLNKKQEQSNKLSTLNANKENINFRNKSIDVDIEDANKKINDKKENLNKIESNLKLKNEELYLLKQNDNNINTNLNNLIYKNNELDKEIQNNKYSLNEYSSKLNVYIDMENHYEGFNKGVKEVLKNKNLKGIYGALGQVITVAGEYEKSIEAALGAYMQNIITQDENSAKFAINYLKKNNLGRVTFLPMNIIKSNKIDIRNLKYGNLIIGIASDLISCDGKYRNIIENILGRTIIIDNIENGIKFARENGHKFKVVTLDGEILNPGGSLTGGSLRTNGNILSRKRLINEFTQKIEEIKSNNSEFINQKQNIENQILNLKKEQTEINNFIKELDRVIIIENSNVNNIKSEIQTLKDNLDKLNNEKKGLEDNLNYTIERTSEVTEQITNIDKEHNQSKIKIEELTKELRNFNNGYETDRSKFEQLSLELVKSKQIHEGILKDIERIKNENKDLHRKYKDIEVLLNNEKIDITKLQEEISIEETEKINLNKQLLDNNKSLENKRISKEGLKSKLEELNKEFKSIDRQYIDLKESLFKIQGKLERVKSSQEAYCNKLFEKYELTIEEAILIKDDSLEIDKKILENLKREIRNIGNVNIDSIKEYEEVKERYDFYSEQKQDLEQSIEAIEKLISDLEENMKAEFEVKFNEINDHFKYVYKRLFGGGYGELIILDKNNILESDIEIIAQPPGKKMKNLNLLSGGEKALTAISILFSILLTKPTPFCILDEIEAPLDDANIARFGEFLKELANNTQFISVTHRRGTMEAADYIYGVTMQEKAISKVLSLNLNEAEKITDVI